MTGDMDSKVFSQAKVSLNHHLTLDPAVPAEVGCAEAVSTILKAAGIRGIPQRGFASTIDLCEWLLINRQFKRIDCHMPGAIVISPTNGSNTGHTGICLAYAIASNNSGNGLFQENYSFDSWTQKFAVEKKLPVFYFLPLDVV